MPGDIVYNTEHIVSVSRQDQPLDDIFALQLTFSNRNTATLTYHDPSARESAYNTLIRLMGGITVL